MKKNNKQIEKFISISLKKINSRYGKFKKNLNLFEQSLDSLDFFSLVFIVEKKYMIKINSNVFEKVQSIEEMAKYIKKKL